MKIEQAILTILVFLLLIGVSGCVNTPVDSRFEEFMLGLLSTDINVKGCQADSLFEYKYTFPKDENYHAVFLTNAVGEKRPTSIAITSKGDIFYMSIENTSIHLLH